MWLVPRRRIPRGPGSLFWLAPALGIGAALGLAAALVAVNYTWNVLSHFAFQGTPSEAHSSLNSIVTAMISLIALVFSVTFVALQLTAGQLSPRVLQIFLHDRIIQLTFGVFVASFVYSMVVLQTVKPGADVPQPAVSVAFLFVFASAAVFTLYIGHVAQLMRASTLIAEIAHQSRKVLERDYPTEPAQPNDVEHLPASKRVIAAPRAGIMIAVNEPVLVQQAARAACVFVLWHRLGDFVPEGAPLIGVHGEPDDVDRLVTRALKQVALGAERVLVQDLTFGFRHLIDIAERALSPSTNDPTTACRAVDALHDLLRQLAIRPLTSDAVCGPDGAVRLVIHRHQFADLLDLTMCEIWLYGSKAAQVPDRIARMLADLADVARPEHQAAVRHWMSVVSE
jgi:uncharacterized membrane protein